MPVRQEEPDLSNGNKIEVSLGGGEIVIPFHFGRQPVASDAMRARLDKYAIAGFRVINSRSTSSDLEVLEELSIIAGEPVEKAPYIVLGFVLSDEGFAKYDKPLRSLGDVNMRDMFRATVDPFERELWYDPSQAPSRIARATLLREVSYPDNKKRDWDAGELLTHLTIAMVERGHVWRRDEHEGRIDPHYEWPARLARALGYAYQLGRRTKNIDHVRDLMIGDMREDIEAVLRFGELTDEEAKLIYNQVNELAGAKVLL